VILAALVTSKHDSSGGKTPARLPRAISKEGKRTHTYEVGDVAYWPPGPDVAIFYRNDGQEIPDPGIIVIGKINSGVEAFNVPSSVRVRVELASSNQADNVRPRSDTLPPVPTLEDVRMVAPALARYTQGTVLGDLWKRPDLSPRDRSIVTVATLIARNQTIEM